MSAASALSVLGDSEWKAIFRQTLKHKQKVDLSSEAFSSVELDVDIKCSSSSGGFLGDYYFIRLSVKSNGDHLPDAVSSAQFKYFAKSLPMDEAKLEMMRATGMATRESLVYAQLLPELDTKSYPRNWSPKCYYNSTELLIFEDLAAEGYKILPNTRYFDDAHLRATMVSLGRLHASSFVLEERFLKPENSTDKRFGSFTKETTFGPDNTIFVAAMKATVALAPLVPDFQQRFAAKFSADGLFEKLFTVQQLMHGTPIGQSPRNVFSHRDLWGNNIMFKYAQDDVERLHPKHSVFVDYQLGRYMPAAFDVLQVLYICTRRAQRDGHLERYLRWYHEALEAEITEAGLNVEELLSWPELLRTYEDFKFSGLVTACLYTPIVRSPGDIFTVMQRTDPERFAVLAHVRRDDFLAEQMSEHPVYKEQIVEALEELLEFVYGDK